MTFLNEEDRKKIRDAVEEAEKGTGGEIVTAIIEESDNYSAREMFFGICIGFITYFLLIPARGSLERIIDSMFWTDSVNLISTLMIVLSFFCACIAYVLAQIPAIDRLLIGKKAMAEAVRRRAMRHFAESAVYDTVDRTGVLLFISVLERRVELIADKGINKRVEDNLWDGIVSELVRGLREKQGADAIVKALKSIGSILAEMVPPREDDVNELGNAPDELEKGS